MIIKTKIPAFAGMTIFCFLLLGYSFNFTFSQDSTKTKPKTDTAYKPTKFILSDLKYSYINQVNPDTVTRKRFLWYPMKNTEDIFNYLPGYYLNYMDVGQLNPVSYNQFSSNLGSVLRHGRPIDDLFGGVIDYNLISRNEIAEIELANGFGNSIYAYTNAVNLIQRQIFQNRPYTEISFTQDRYENIYFDGNFHQNLFRNLNFNFGITKHSYDGKYINSDFDKWLGRFNLNFAASNKLNFFAYVNYATIQNGVNHGINPDTVNLGIKAQVFNPDLAVVVNSDGYEKKERFDVDVGAVLLTWKNSFTKLQLYTSNSFTRYRDEENRLNSNGFFMAENLHWINYGAKLQQIFNFRFSNDIEAISRSEGEYDKYLSEISFNFEDTNFTRIGDLSRISYISDLLLKYKNISLEGYVKGYTDDNFASTVFSPGIRAEYTFVVDSLTRASVYAKYDCSRDYYSGGIYFKLSKNVMSISYYNYTNEKLLFNVINLQNAVYENINVSGLNSAADLNLYKLNFKINFSVNLKLYSEYLPRYYGNADLSFHDMAFKNKLEYKIGLVSRGWSEYQDYVRIPQNATLDFYIMGKIGRATFGITFENILDRVIYNTGVYPNIDRGGLANVISRFNITWNFFD